MKAGLQKRTQFNLSEKLHKETNFIRTMFILIYLAKYAYYT